MRASSQGITSSSPVQQSLKRMLFNVKKSVFSNALPSEQAPEINLIAFIDVLLVVLIFLMISTTFTKYQELSITLPTADGAKSISKPIEIAIAITSDSRISVDGKRINLDELDHQLKKQTDGQNLQNVTVVVSADGKSTHQTVMQVLESARNTGLVNVVFATQSKNSQK